MSDKKILQGDFGRVDELERKQSALDEVITNSRSQLSKADCLEVTKYDENGVVL